MWQMKELKIPYESILSNETIIWMVVKKNIRPDSTGISMPNNEINFVQRFGRFLEVKQCSKSESSFMELKKIVDSPVMPTYSIRNIDKNPRILMNKPLRVSERSLYGSHHRNKIPKKHEIIRKKLSNCKIISNIFTQDQDDLDMSQIFIDSQLCLRLPEQILLVESEFIRMFRNCWHRNKHERNTAFEVANKLQQLLNVL